MKTPVWNPPAAWTRITTIDAHTEGEPFRVVVSGFPALPGETMLDRRRFARQHCDHLRTALMWEPRGHADMYGCLLTPKASADADFGVLFMHNEGFSTMCGHGIIGITTVVIETGMISPADEIRIDTPAGLVRAFPEMSGSRVRRVRFQNVPSFVVALDATVEVAGLGTVQFDLAFGGAFYAFVRQDGLASARASELAAKGMAIKRAVMARHRIEHPFDRDLSFLYGTIFTGAALQPGNHSRQVCVFAEGEIDRSPTGTGVSARLAILQARGELAPNQQVNIESIIGSTFSGRIVREEIFGGCAAVIPEVSGSAWITGRHEFVISPDDGLRNGFLV